MPRGCRKTACCAASPATSKNPATIRLGAQVKVYREFDELLADRDVELVDICTPTALHPAQVIAALTGGQACALRKTAGAKFCGRAENFESGRRVAKHF